MVDPDRLDDVYDEAPPKKGPWKGILLGGCVVLLLLGLLLCCGGVVLVLFLPGQLAQWAVTTFVDDAPLPAPTARWEEPELEALAERLAADLEDDRTVALTGEEFSQLMTGAIDDPQLTVFHVTVDDQDKVAFDLSYQIDPTQQQWFNMHMKGDVEMEDGWFTEFTIDEWEAGSFDLGPYMAGQDLTADANQNLAQQKVQDPQVAELVAMVEHLGIENGLITLTVTEEGIEQLKAEGEL